MSDSPKKKKAKLIESNELKRSSESSGSTSKRNKKEAESEEHMDSESQIRAKKRHNFIVACKKVSRETYFDIRSRYHLTYIPQCLRVDRCVHRDPKFKVAVMPSFAEESFKIEVKTNMWSEALEVCLLSITPTHYLSAEVLKDIVEIMLNSHDDPDSTYSINEILIKCQQILSQNFNAHPPCLLRKIRKCYTAFLSSPMDRKDKTFTNRTDYGCEKGIIMYCLNRLKAEMEPNTTPDGPIIDKMQHVPEDMKQSVKGLHWQKEKFEIYECLERTERIQRLFLVLDSIIQLLAADLAIWVNRHPTSQGQHLQRDSRPLCARALWPQVLLTGSVGPVCRQIIELFAYAIDLGYPEYDIEVLTMWVNTIAQTFYLCEPNCNNDYPNTGKYCKSFAKEFFKILENGNLSRDSMSRIIENIQPAFIRYEVAFLYLKTIISDSYDNVMEQFIAYLKDNGWKRYESVNTELVIRENKYRKVNIKNLIKTLTQNCNKLLSKGEEKVDIYMRKSSKETKCSKVDQNFVTNLFYYTMEAYLETYRVKDVQSTLTELNERTDIGKEDEDDQQDLYPYGTSVDYIKIYRNIYTFLKDIIKMIRDLKKNDCYHDSLRVFKKLELVG